LKQRNFIFNRLGWIHIEVLRVDFDGEFYVVKAGRKIPTGQIIRHFININPFARMSFGLETT
jgi:hypothetical protein